MQNNIAERLEMYIAAGVLFPEDPETDRLAQILRDTYKYAHTHSEAWPLRGGELNVPVRVSKPDFDPGDISLNSEQLDLVVDRLIRSESHHYTHLEGSFKSFIKHILAPRFIMPWRILHSQTVTETYKALGVYKTVNTDILGDNKYAHSRVTHTTIGFIVGTPGGPARKLPVYQYNSVPSDNPESSERSTVISRHVAKPSVVNGEVVLGRSKYLPYGSVESTFGTLWLGHNSHMDQLLTYIGAVSPAARPLVGYNPFPVGSAKHTVNTIHEKPSTTIESQLRRALQSDALQDRGLIWAVNRFFYIRYGLKLSDVK